MPTIEKRLTVTPSPTVGPILRELSQLTGKAPAAIVRELLDEAAPAMKEVADALKIAKRRPQQAIAAFQRMATQAHSDLAQLQLDIAQAQGKKPGPKPKAAKKKPGRGAAKTG